MRAALQSLLKVHRITFHYSGFCYFSLTYISSTWREKDLLSKVLVISGKEAHIEKGDCFEKTFLFLVRLTSEWIWQLIRLKRALKILRLLHNLILILCCFQSWRCDWCSNWITPTIVIIWGCIPLIEWNLLDSVLFYDSPISSWFLKDDGILLIPTVADPPPKLNSWKRIPAEFQDRMYALLSIASMSGGCQVRH